MNSFTVRNCRPLAALPGAGAAAHFVYVLVGMFAHASSFTPIADSSSLAMLTLEICTSIINSGLDRLRAWRKENAVLIRERPAAAHGFSEHRVLIEALSSACHTPLVVRR